MGFLERSGERKGTSQLPHIKGLAFSSLQSEHLKRISQRIAAHHSMSAKHSATIGAVPSCLPDVLNLLKACSSRVAKEVETAT
jgi:hypothetical protein